MGSGGPGKPPLWHLPAARLAAVIEGFWYRQMPTNEARTKLTNLLKRGTRATIPEVPGVPVPSWFPDDALPSRPVPESL